jgi:hypothetical protein
MSLKKEIEIDYMKRRTKINLPKNYSEFVKLCKETFYLSKDRSELMSLVYYDNEGYENIIDEDEYDKEDCRKAEYWKLIIEEEEEEENAEDIDTSKSKEQLMKTKNEIIEKSKKYKEELYQKFSKKAQEGIKARTEQHKKTTQKLQDEYKNCLEELKIIINTQYNENIEQISNNVIDMYKKNVDLMNIGIIDNLKEPLKEFTNICQKKLEEVKLNEIKDSINKMQDCIAKCITNFNND